MPCLNQHDIPERNAQIRLMKRVYEGADIVLIWLGLEVDATGSAIEQSKKTEATSMSILHGRVFKISSSDRGGLAYGLLLL
jgi:hypothetical protein